MHLEPAGTRLGLYFGARWTNKPDLKSSPLKAEAEMKGGGDRSGAAPLMEYLHDSS